MNRKKLRWGYNDPMRVLVTYFLGECCRIKGQFFRVISHKFHLKIMISLAKLMTFNSFKHDTRIFYDK